MMFEDEEDTVEEKITVDQFKDLQQKKIKLEGKASVLDALMASKLKELDTLIKQLPEEAPKDRDGSNLREYVKSLQSQILSDTNKLATMINKVEKELEALDSHEV